LNVSIAVVIGIGEDGAKGCPAVMISHQQDRGRMNLLKNSAKNLVGGAITRMNEVAGDDDERNAAVIAIDNVDDAGKASGRVEPIQLSAGGRQMYVAKNNELHWRRLNFAQAIRPATLPREARHRAGEPAVAGNRLDGYSEKFAFCTVPPMEYPSGDAECPEDFRLGKLVGRKLLCDLPLLHHKNA
jgi:hypothetical protein